MKHLETIAQLRAWRTSRASGPNGSTLGLVPTMGALHSGHLALVERSVAENGRTLATIFVNPSQFNDPGDLTAYPRDLDNDLDLLRGVGCDAVFTPSPEEIYPAGFQTWIDPGPLGDRLEGASRPGHFRGVATIVTKLLNLTHPERAYFGRKDAQQLCVVRRLAHDLGFGTEIVGCETVREPDGLAMSSRNRRLSPNDRAVAGALYRSMVGARDAWLRGETDSESLRRIIRKELETHPAIELDYLSIADPFDLTEIDPVEPATEALLSLAAYVGEVRLIDNITLTRTGDS